MLVGIRRLSVGVFGVSALMPLLASAVTKELDCTLKPVDEYYTYTIKVFVRYSDGDDKAWVRRFNPEEECARNQTCVDEYIYKKQVRMQHIRVSNSFEARRRGSVQRVENWIQIDRSNLAANGELVHPANSTLTEISGQCKIVDTMKLL